MCASSYSSSTQIAKNIFLVFFFFFFFRRAHFFGVCTRWRNTKARDRRNGNFHGYDVQSYSALAPTALLFLSNLSSSSSLASACDNNIGFFFFFFARLLCRRLVSSAMWRNKVQQSTFGFIEKHFRRRERWVWLGTWLELISLAWANCRLLARRDTAMM